MVSFFQNIFSWFVENKDEIILFFTSTNFVTFVSTIVLLVKQLKASRKNTEASNNLIASIEELKSISVKLDSLHSKLDSATGKFDIILNRLNQIEKRSSETEESCLEKIEAMLDVQSIVYSSIKDETMRKNVSNIISTAKLREVSNKAELQKQVEELKQSLSNKINNAVKTIEDETSKISEKVKTTATTTSKKRATSRY